MKYLKAFGLMLAVGLCAAFVLSPDAYAAPIGAVAHADTGMLSLMHVANLVLAVGASDLRAQHADYVARAAAKIAEVKDGMAAEDVRRIETEHGVLIRDVATIAAALATAERAPPAQDNTRAHSWTGEDIGKITARAKAFGLTAEDANAVMADNTVRSLEAATDKLQDKAAAKAPTRQNPHVTITRDAGDTLRDAVSSSIMLRANPQALKPTDPLREAARNYRGMSLMEVGRVFTEETQGIRLRGLDKRELAGVLLGMDVRAGMHSTSDFANLLANVASKRLREAYAVAPSSWKRFMRQSNNPDFKAKSVVQLSSAPAFKRVREGAEFTYGGLTEGVESYSLATYGRIIAITRQALINDDLSAFDRLPNMLGRAAADLEATTAWGILLDNSAMSDTVALFHADHGNLPSAAAIDETSLKAAKALMRKQRSLAAKSADREYLNLEPKFLIVGPDKEVEAQKMLTAVTPNATSGVNVFASSMELIVEARVTGNKWFMAADPSQIDTVEYAYLEGEEGIFTEQRTGFEIDGIEVKGRVDFAAKAIDWRGLVYNSGA